MGLGPHASELLDRTGHPEIVWRDPFAMQMEQLDRAEQRRLRRIYLATRNRAPKKPEAPVLPLGKVKGKDRGWLWNGDSIPSKGFYNGHEYVAADIRKAGFKLPKIGGKAQASGRRKDENQI